MQAPAEEPVVALNHVTIQFSAAPLLEQVSLRVHAAQVIGIQGSNGSGKTSLLRLLANIASPAGGTRIGPKSCAYVPSAIDPLSMRAGDWLRFFPRTNRTDPRAMLQQLGFDSDLSKRITDLSFGNMRKLLLAEAFTSGETLLVIDELTAGLDRHGSRAAAAAVAQLANTGAAIVFADQQDRHFTSGAQIFQIQSGDLIEIDSRPDTTVELTLRGPLAEAAALTQTAQTFGFAPPT